MTFKIDCHQQTDRHCAEYPHSTLKEMIKLCDAKSPITKGKQQQGALPHMVYKMLENIRAVGISCLMLTS